ncbi:hypothetical protein HanIR_Chr14g0702421 [Helianthus annuus]|nr:hypothetical protein HanIR_Chr14g0702421 [Helianthus annuus]
MYTLSSRGDDAAAIGGGVCDETVERERVAVIVETYSVIFSRERFGLCRGFSFFQSSNYSFQYYILKNQGFFPEQ